MNGASALQIVGLLITPFIISVGQLLFKLASADASEGNVGKLLFNPTLWIALVLYGCTTIGWLFVIRGVPISRAYSFMALSFVYVPFLSVLFLGENLSTRLVLGTAIICAGIFVSMSD
jgi:drug/metabolite transporter (DMT)-like permease